MYGTGGLSGPGEGWEGRTERGASGPGVRGVRGGGIRGGGARRGWRTDRGVEGRVGCTGREASGTCSGGATGYSRTGRRSRLRTATSRGGYRSRRRSAGCIQGLRRDPGLGPSPDRRDTGAVGVMVESGCPCPSDDELVRVRTPPGAPVAPVPDRDPGPRRGPSHRNGDTRLPRGCPFRIDGGVPRDRTGLVGLSELGGAEGPSCGRVQGYRGRRGTHRLPEVHRVQCLDRVGLWTDLRPRVQKKRKRDRKPPE